MSDTILWISRSTSQADFLKDFYGFTNVIENWNLEVLHDYVNQGFDVALVRSSDNLWWLLVGVVDRDTYRLSPVSRSNIYHDSVLWYRIVSESEISDINSDNNVVYNYDFFSDNTFTSFNIRNFQLEEFNSGDIIEMILDISPSFNENFVWEDWSSLPQDEIFTYSLVF